MKDKTFITDHNFMPFNDLPFSEGKYSFRDKSLPVDTNKKYTVIGTIF